MYRGWVGGRRNGARETVEGVGDDVIGNMSLTRRIEASMPTSNSKHVCDGNQIIQIPT